MGQVHLNVGPMVGSMMTEHVPPFWHFCPPVLHGFWYWQYSPVYAEGHLKFGGKSKSNDRCQDFLIGYLVELIFARLFSISHF